jgi:hypothetical protein
MRTTITIEDELLKEAKRVAAASGRTLTSLVEDALREALARHRTSPVRRKVTLKTVSGGQLRPGVDLDNSAALLDIMEGFDSGA